MSTPRTDGGSLLRQALDEAQRQIDATPAPVDGGTRVTAFLAYDRETGAQLGAAVHWRGPGKSEWSVTGALSRKVQAAQSPYGVRLELHGSL